MFNLLEELKNLVMESDYNTDQKIYLINNFAENEIYDSVNVDSYMVIMNICSAFVLVRENA